MVAGGGVSRPRHVTCCLGLPRVDGVLPVSSISLLGWDPPGGGGGTLTGISIAYPILVPAGF